MSKISLKGVLVGGVVDVMATNLLSLPVMFYVMAKIHAADVPKDQLQSAVMSSIHSAPFLFAIQALIGVGCSVLGGYVAARLAKRSEGLNGAVSAWLCVGIGVYSLVVGGNSASVGLTIADFVVAPLAGFVGGYLYQKIGKVRAGEARE